MIWWCKYCRRHRRLREDKYSAMYAEIKDGFLKMKSDAYGVREVKVPINYCPKCGRKLGGKGWN